MIGFAFGGGLLLATMLGGGRSRHGRHDESQGGPHSGPQSTGSLHRQTQDTWEHVKGTLVGLASSKAVQILDEWIPGFQEHFGKRQLR
jgi:hypothetical protein